VDHLQKSWCDAKGSKNVFLASLRENTVFMKPSTFHPKKSLKSLKFLIPIADRAFMVGGEGTKSPPPGLK
jgi:hypothetical protein